MNKLFNLRHPFFRPAWRRAATTAVLGGWTIFELSTGSGGWAVMFGAAAVYCVYEFFVVFDPANYEERDG